MVEVRRTLFFLPHSWRDSMLKTCASLVHMEMENLTNPQGYRSEMAWSLPCPWECTGGLWESAALEQEVPKVRHGRIYKGNLQIAIYQWQSAEQEQPHTRRVLSSQPRWFFEDGKMVLITSKYKGEWAGTFGNRDGAGWAVIEMPWNGFFCLSTNVGVKAQWLLPVRQVLK